MTIDTPGKLTRPHRASRLFVLSVLALLSAMALSGVAHAVPTSGSGTEAGQSFAEAFFISKTTDVNGQKRLVILGSLVIWSLLAMSMLSLGLIGHMAMTNTRKVIMPAGVVSEIRQLLAGGKYREALDLTKKEPSHFSKIIHAGLREAPHGYAAMIHGLDQFAEELTTERLRRIEYLNVLGQVSPMIGLFGTVYGMILAFQAIVVAGGNADPVLLAGGISTALTTTFWGLIVAIPALAGYAVIRNRIDAFTMEALLEAEHLLGQFRPKSKGASPAQPSPSPSPKPQPKAES